MKISEIKEEQITNEIVDKVIYSGMEYQNQHLDVAIVLGSAKAHLYRVPYAVAEYKNGRIGKVIVSGGDMKLEGKQINEGKFLKSVALEQGVKEQDILVEDKAQYTLENFEFSRALMIEQGLLHKGMNLGIVTNAFHMRRSLMMAKRIFVDDEINIIPLPGQDYSSRRENWFETEKGRNLVMGEFKRLIWYAQQGIIDDFEV